MLDVERASWTLAQCDLWRRIEAHPFEQADHALDFTKRLARDRGWSLDFARGAVREYRRFCFLAMVFDTPVTPSEEVDEVWHQHLTYSRDYWEIWCAQVLGRSLHHDPTAGGPAEQSRYRAQYAETLARYEAYFGAPDAVFWPGTRQRFRGRPRYRIVDEDRVLLLPRPRLTGWLSRAVGALVLLFADPPPAEALPLDPSDWTSELVFSLYAVLGFAAWFLTDLRRRLRMLDHGAGRPADDLGLIEIAMLAGGRRQAADAIVIGWLQGGAAKLEPHPSRWVTTAAPRIAIDDAAARMPAEWDPYRGTARGSTTRDELLAALSGRLDGVAASLARRDLIPSPEVARWLRIEALLIFSPVILLGSTMIFVGLSRGTPVGFLVFVTIALVMFCAAFAGQPPSRTEGGEETLADYRTRYRRAAEAPQEHELLFAFALGGAGILAGTSLAEYGDLIQGTDKDRGGGCGSSGCGGCGGD